MVSSSTPTNVFIDILSNNFYSKTRKFTVAFIGFKDRGLTKDTQLRVIKKYSPDESVAFPEIFHRNPFKIRKVNELSRLLLTFIDQQMFTLTLVVELPNNSKFGIQRFNNDVIMMLEGYVIKTQDFRVRSIRS